MTDTTDERAQCQRMKPSIILGGLKQQCPNPAMWVPRIEMFSHPAVQAVAPMKPLLTAAVDLEVCPTCAAELKVTDILAPAEIHALEQHAARSNGMIKADRSQTMICLIPLRHPELKVLRKTMETTQQQAQRGQGAGDA